MFSNIAGESPKGVSRNRAPCFAGLTAKQTQRWIIASGSGMESFYGEEEPFSYWQLVVYCVVLMRSLLSESEERFGKTKIYAKPIHCLFKISHNYLHFPKTKVKYFVFSSLYMYYNVCYLNFTPSYHLIQYVSV